MALSTEHKEALAEGRRYGRIVDAYLQALHEHKPRRGRKRTPETIRKQLAEIDEQLPKASLLKALSLNARKENLKVELESLEGDQSGPSVEETEKEFVKVAKDYADRKNIPYSAWRAAGVPADTLKKAGIIR